MSHVIANKSGEVHASGRWVGGETGQIEIRLGVGPKQNARQSGWSAHEREEITRRATEAAAAVVRAAIDRGVKAQKVAEEDGE
jgi:hypothetical protein